MNLEEILKAVAAAQGGTNTPTPAQPDPKAADLVQKLFAALPTLLALVLPLLPVLQRLVTSKGEPKLEPKTGPTPVDPHEPIPPPPGVVAPPLELGRAILEVPGFIHGPTGIVAFADVTRDLDGNRIGDGSYWADRITKRRALNNGTKILVTPTVYAAGAAGRELDSDDWDRLGWLHNIKYFAAVEPDPSNPQSVQEPGVSGFVGDGTPETTITIDPKGAPANVGGDRYRNGKGRAATFKVFAEGKWRFWAELPLPGGGVLTTDAVEFVVR